MMMARINFELGMYVNMGALIDADVHVESCKQLLES